MPVAVHVAPWSDPSAAVALPVSYRWDVDTDILAAVVRHPEGAGGEPGSVELEGADGSWVVLDLQGGRIHGVEVAVWPDVKTRPALAPPPTILEGDVTLILERRRNAPRGVATVEVETALMAETDVPERTVHFRFGATDGRTVRVAADILLDLDARGGIAGIWLLNVPPFPDDE